MKNNIFTSDWFIGLMVCLLVLVASGSKLILGIEATTYDLGIQLSQRQANERIHIIAIDDDSIANIGRWPWPRDLHGQMIDILHKGGAKVIGQTVMFLEPQQDPGLKSIQALLAAVKESNLSKSLQSELSTLQKHIADQHNKHADADQLKTFFDNSALKNKIPAEVSILQQSLMAAEAQLNTDKLLAASIEKAGNLILAMALVPGTPKGLPDEELPDSILANVLLNIDQTKAKINPEKTTAAYSPIEDFARHALAIGHLNPQPDLDGNVRSENLVMEHYGQLIPSMALQIAARSLNLKADDIQVADGIKMGGLSIGTDSKLNMNSFFYHAKDKQKPFSTDSFFDVLSEKVPAKKFKDKIVLIGTTAVGLGDLQNTPIGLISPIESLAHTVSSILNEDYFIAPDWAGQIRLAIILLVIIYLILILPRLKAGPAAIFSFILMAGLIGVQLFLMVQQSLLIELTLPALMVLLGHIVLTTTRFLVTEQGKAKSDAMSAESNRMLGLSYQSKGDLDMAYASFRQCPMDESIMDLMYNLALDFERKRQFNKASNVYQYLAGYDSNYKDLKSRISSNEALDKTLILGGANFSNSGTLIVEGGVQKPMLGRYQVEKELGKGAMGVVYLGADPKINRTVAIKTMAISQEFAADEVEEVKQRFFREAETAGRLTHPNIVTIFDAGEEQDLAYIAMEFLQGRDLEAYTKADNLLPMTTVMDLVAMAAEALDYAHQQNVVHRDIKPANIMYEPETGSMKITDFGIARITDSSKTKTGMVLGTPSYMSPEQLAGQRVDGRSDLFSLGVMLFELITGQQPFDGESIATLMFKIANEKHPRLTDLRPEAPECLNQIIDRALSKSLEDRFQKGNEFARELRQCQQQQNP